MSKRDKRDADLEAEIRSHLEMAARERVRDGQSLREAQDAAQREFGNVGLIKEVTHDMWSGASLEAFLQDVRYGLRMLVKSPAFALIAISTLALGIGANTAVFSIVNGVLLNPLPYPHPEQLVTLHESKPNFDNGSISYPNFRDWQKNNHTFSAMAISRITTFILGGHGQPEQIRGVFVSSDFFPLLGIKPLAGRMLRPGEDEVGVVPMALLSESLWREKFGSDPNVVGQGITLDGKSYSIIGVLPDQRDLLLASFRSAAVYVPIGQWTNNLLLHRGSGLGIHGIGRLKPGVTVEQARADMLSVSRNLAAAYPDVNKGIAATMFPLKQDMVRSSQSVLWVLLGAVGFVLLIACVNVANLLLARSKARSREFAVRFALGAAQGRVIRQLLTESTMLAVSGGVLGLLVAKWGTHAALATLPSALPRASGIGLDGRVLAFTFLISLVAGILFGLAPALRISAGNLFDTLKDNARGFSGSRAHTQKAFVVIEMATALVLLVGAGLMVRTLVGLWNVDPGFDPHHVLSFGISLPPSFNDASPAKIRAAFREAERQINSTPGIQASSFTWGSIPLQSDDETPFWIEGQPKPTSDNEKSWALNYLVGADYLNAMGIPLLRGRFFTESENESSVHVAVIDDVFAHKFFPNSDPIDKRLYFGEKNSVEIVGIVGHVNQWGIDRDAVGPLRTQLYRPLFQLPEETIGQMVGGMGVLVRSESAPSDLFQAIRNSLARSNSEIVAFGAETMDASVAASIATKRFVMILLSCFAALALLLASVGIYGVLSYLVGSRTQEIGVRMALGAQRFDVLKMILGDGARMTLLGIGIGVAAALALTRLMSGMLFGVKSTDPFTFAIVAVLLCAIALLACYVPARKAMRVDPMVALRYE
ncbi:MAG TPA: ABC transporter permease [Terriglobales bacterium]|nr:ABC transporter permease [Terriglobales bacterium]